MRWVHDFTLGQYWPGDSLVHRLDPRSKILCLLLLLTALFRTGKLVEALPLILVLMGAYQLASIPWSRALRGLRPFIWLFLLTAALHLLRGPASGGIPIWGGGPEIALQGLSEGGIVALRLAVALLASSLLTLTTTPQELGYGLERMIRPLRRLGFPVEDLALTVMLTVRFLPILLGELDRIMKAQASRGWDPKQGGPVKRIQNLLPILLPLMSGVLERADRIALALQCRGYRSGQVRTRYRAQRLARLDQGVIIGFGILVAAMEMFRRAAGF